MKHEHIDRRARVWTVSMGADGRLEEQLDAELLARLAEASSPEEVSAALAAKIARTRTW